jgi:hypothetical protein
MTDRPLIEIVKEAWPGEWAWNATIPDLVELAVFRDLHIALCATVDASGTISEDVCVSVWLAGLSLTFHGTDTAAMVRRAHHAVTVVIANLARSVGVEHVNAELAKEEGND